MNASKIGIHAVRLFLIALSLAAAEANATFHLWRMTELYSNADGSVQYLELAVSSSGEGLLSGHVLTSSRGNEVHYLVFPNDLQGDTGGKTFLIGTEGFAALGLVMPDYVVPNGFFFAGGGDVNFADVDGWHYPALPVAGALSLNRDGTTGKNSPTNFAGSTGTILPAPSAALNFQALWWHAPAGSESGWGLNITHQADTLFATWFTYDTDGSGMWLVMSNGNKTANNTYAGALYRTTGPSFDATPFNPAQVVLTPVGSATLTFVDENSGTFAYTVGSVSQSKAIIRLAYSSPVATCVSGGSAGASPNYQDLWWRTGGTESGWGVNITHQGDILFATWFTYGADGRGRWVVMSDGHLASPRTYTGALYRTTGPAFNAVPWSLAQVANTQVGTGTFNFTDANNGTFAYTLDGVSQTKPITRLVYATPATVCH
jgi:hypothetical protein